MLLEVHRGNSFRVASSTLSDIHVPRIAKAQPWAEMANAFSVIRRAISFHTLSTASGSALKHLG